MVEQKSQTRPMATKGNNLFDIHVRGVSGGYRTAARMASLVGGRRVRADDSQRGICYVDRLANKKSSGTIAGCTGDPT